MNTETLARLIKYQKDYAELYTSTPLIGISFNYIQLDDVSEIEKLPGEIDMRERDCEDYPYEYSKIVDGVEFIAITNDKHEEES